jgi:WD40 repeat protein
VYETTTFKRIDKGLEGHKESVQCLVKINEKMFASASIDGMVIIWDTNELKVIKKLNEPAVPKPNSDKQKSEEIQNGYAVRSSNPSTPVAETEISRCQMPHVRHLALINNRYISVAIGKSIHVYDIDSGLYVFKVEWAHDADIVSIISLHHGNVLVSSSEDSTIKIWNTYGKFPIAPLSAKPSSKELASTNNSPRRNKRRSANKENNVHPALLGTLSLHTDAVHDLLPLSPYSFASCGADKLIMIWKDNRIEKRIRNFYAFKYQSFYSAYLQNSKDNYGHSPMITPKTTSTILSPTQVLSPIFSPAPSIAYNDLDMESMK